MPIGTVYKGRRPIAASVDGSAEEDLITSRILWLDGLEENNANTKERYIYIHGTNQEQSIGQAASSGCIRMLNTDVIRLFDLVEVGGDRSVRVVVRRLLCDSRVTQEVNLNKIAVQTNF